VDRVGRPSPPSPFFFFHLFLLGIVLQSQIGDVSDKRSAYQALLRFERIQLCFVA